MQQCDRQDREEIGDRDFIASEGPTRCQQVSEGPQAVRHNRRAPYVRVRPLAPPARELAQMTADRDYNRCTLVRTRECEHVVAMRARNAKRLVAAVAE